MIYLTSGKDIENFTKTWKLKSTNESHLKEIWYESKKKTSAHVYPCLLSYLPTHLFSIELFSTMSSLLLISLTEAYSQEVIIQ